MYRKNPIADSLYVCQSFWCGCNAQLLFRTASASATPSPIQMTPSPVPFTSHSSRFSPFYSYQHHYLLIPYNPPDHTLPYRHVTFSMREDGVDLCVCVCVLGGGEDMDMKEDVTDGLGAVYVDQDKSDEEPGEYDHYHKKTEKVSRHGNR